MYIYINTCKYKETHSFICINFSLSLWEWLLKPGSHEQCWAALPPLLFSFTVEQAGKLSEQLQCFFSYSLLASHHQRKALEFCTCRYWTCWLFAFSVSSFSLSFQVLPSFMDFLCQKQMSYGHRPPASVTLFTLSFHQLLSLSQPVAISCTE